MGGFLENGADIVIYEDANNKQISTAGFISPTYRPPKGIKRGSPEAQIYLGGAENFLVTELEFYVVDFK